MGVPVIENRKARHNYHVLESFEVGIALKGTEVKSVRQGKMALAESFVAVRAGELYLVNAHIDPYEKGNVFNHAPLRERKLLAHRREITEMDEAVARKGLTLVPLKAYFKEGRLKLQVAVCKGKAAQDKRADKAKQEAQREIARALRVRNR